MPMTSEVPGMPRSRVAFLLTLAIIITGLLCWVIKGFLLAVFMAAVLAGLLHPLYRRVLKWMGGRKGLAAGGTVFLGLVLVIIPGMLFLGLVVSEASQMTESAKEWLVAQEDSSAGLQQRLAENPHLKKLVPYQDEIIEKAGQLAAKAGGWVTQGLAAGVKGTASFFLTIFVMLYAMSYFLTDGRELLNSTLRYTPLSKDDQARLLGTFVSVTRATLKGKVVIGIVQGGLAAASFWLAGIEGVFFWGTVMAVLSVIPALGTAIIWVPAVIYLAINGQTGAAIGVGLWCALVVSTIDNFLNPILIGKDAQMPDLLVLLTTLGGLAVFGVPGMIIGPIIGSLSVAIWELWGGAVDEARNGEPSPARVGAPV